MVKPGVYGPFTPSRTNLTALELAVELERWRLSLPGSRRPTQREVLEALLQAFERAVAEREPDHGG